MLSTHKSYLVLGLSFLTVACEAPAPSQPHSNPNSSINASPQSDGTTRANQNGQESPGILHQDLANQTTDVTEVDEIFENEFWQTIEQAKAPIRDHLITDYREKNHLLRGELGEGNEYLRQQFMGSRLELIRNVAANAVNQGLIAHQHFERMIQVLRDEIPEISIDEIEQTVNELELIEEIELNSSPRASAPIPVPESAPSPLPLVSPSPLSAAVINLPMLSEIASSPSPLASPVEAPARVSALGNRTDDELRTQLAQLRGLPKSTFASWNRQRLESTLARIAAFRR